MNAADFALRHAGKVAAAVLAVGLVWWVLAGRHQMTRDELIAFGKSLPAFWFAAAFLILPLLGFPLSIFLVLAGVRFGFAGGMALVTPVVFAQNLIAHHLAAGSFRERVRIRVAKAGYKIPSPREANQWWFTVLFASIHGPPYAMKLYLLALTDIPFRVYFWAGAPVYVLFCLIPVGAGSSAMNVDVRWIYGVVIGITAVTLVGVWLKRKFGNTVG